MAHYTTYVFIGCLALYLVWRRIQFEKVKARLPELLKRGAVVVDVRTKAEFASGHFEGSINIPLPDLASRANELDSQRSLILCCASGNRSRMGAMVMRRKGYKQVVNAGSWTNLLAAKSQVRETSRQA